MTTQFPKEWASLINCAYGGECKPREHCGVGSVSHKAHTKAKWVGGRCDSKRREGWWLCNNATLACIGGVGALWHVSATDKGGEGRWVTEECPGLGFSP